MPDQFISSRKQAKDKGLTTYFTGKPCLYGHISKRATKSGNCIQCLRTVHRGKINERVRRNSIGKPFRWQINNEKTISGARMANQKWCQEDIRMVLMKSDSGEYFHSAIFLARELKRTFRAIERARARYKKIEHEVQVNPVPNSAERMIQYA